MRTIEELFWSKVDKNGPLPIHRPDLGPCWLWIGAASNGYGNLKIAGRTVKAYRVSYEWTFGIIPPGLQPDHLCRVRRCVRPTHFEITTPRVNTLRGDTITGRNARKTHCAHGHEYTEANTYRLVEAASPYPRRSCRICMYAKKTRNRRRKAMSQKATD